MVWGQEGALVAARCQQGLSWAAAAAVLLAVRAELRARLRRVHPLPRSVRGAAAAASQSSSHCQLGSLLWGRCKEVVV